ncbi:MAG: SUMF1/EgtB/PvdO family nonheme iron enzyme [Gammaproteobacteria bacterium]|nr:SUMF1/EgtB/PvdO family nonheme iron enzyme [Gammaproteobacteria bacterium]
MNERILMPLIPLNTLRADDLRLLARNAKLQTLPGGKTTSLAGIKSKLYLLKGKVTLLANGKVIETVEGGKPEARHALNRARKEPVAMHTETNVCFVIVDMLLLGTDTLQKIASTRLATLTAPAVAKAEARKRQWIKRLLESPLFHLLPPSNIRRVIDHLEESCQDKGDIVIQQGDKNDAFYVMKKGQSRVVRSYSKGIQTLDKMVMGNMFGATSLLTDDTNAVSVVMVSSGEVMQLNKDDFFSWIAKPLEVPVDYRKAAVMAQKGAVWLDVRNREEYRKERIPNSIHIPLENLHIPFTALTRLVKGLEPGRRYLVYSNSEKRSSAAAFRFLEQGIPVGVLEDGLHSVPTSRVYKPQSTEILRQQKEAALKKVKLAELKKAKLDAQVQARAESAELLKRAKEKMRRLEAEKEQQTELMKHMHDAQSAREEKEKLERQQAQQALEMQRLKLDQEAVLLQVQRNAAHKLAEEKQELERYERLAKADQPKRRYALGLLLLLMLAVGATVLFTTPLYDELLRIIGLKEEAFSGSDSQPAPVETAVTDRAGTEDETETEDTSENFASYKANIAPLEIYRDKLSTGKLGPVMARLPKGSFWMGSKPHLPYPNEHPQLRITLRSFSISKYEITFEEYIQFAKNTGRKIPDDRHWGRGRQPVINVNWRNASAYARWLSDKTGHRYRLPSEREWEYAAGAGTESAYWWGDKLGVNNANCAICGSHWDGKMPAPAGSFPPNRFGLHDTSGNVMEWTRECKHKNYKNAPLEAQTWEGGDCSRRMVRGGSFRGYKKALRTMKRKDYNLNAYSDELGFRVVRVD